MITEALLHCPGIGPARLAKLQMLGVLSWTDVIARANEIPSSWRDAAVQESQRCLEALDRDDVGYFVDQLAPKDRWRILSHFLDEVSFFDIETAGLEYDDPITVIACWHKGALHTFVEHENLDDFLDLLDDVTLLASFNGGSFDVPRVLDAFHIPEFPCPHLDLRWLCYHQGLRGGLKEITFLQGITRPVDLQDANGELAIQLWARWEHFQDQAARDELIRYCACDVLLLILVAECLVGKERTSPKELWEKLPGGETTVHRPDESPRESPIQAGAFGTGSPARLRGRIRRAWKMQNYD